MNRPRFISRETQVSYFQAVYCVEDTRERAIYELRVGQHDNPVDTILLRHNARRGLIVTAWNPYSVAQPLIKNKACNVRLRRHWLVIRTDVRVYPATGYDNAGTWQEEGFFLTNIGCGKAHQLLTLFHQNAGVMVEIGRPPRLIWHPAARLQQPS